MKRTEPMLIKDVLAIVQEQCDMNSHLAQRRAIAAWPSIVGPWIAQRTRCVRFQGSVLIIAAGSAPLRQELNMMRAPLCQALCKASGEADTVADLRFISFTGS